MANLKERYERLIKDNEKWCYYSLNIPEFSFERLKDEEQCYKFINDYFRCGKKEQILFFEQLSAHVDKIKKRAPHIVSTFFLGILIARSFGINVDKREENINFKYLWFMACLYHDVGYIYEEDLNCEYLLYRLQTDGLTAVREIFGIEYMSEEEFSTYCQKYVDIYLSGRAKCINEKIGKVDHGIVGGLMLYDGLKKNYENVKKNREVISEGETECFCCDELIFSSNNFKHFAEAADAIIAHNIWPETLERFLENKGEKKGERFYIPGNKKLAFVLALADTLEPLKRVNDINVLEEIEFEPMKDKNGFVVSIPKKYDAICTAVENLRNWVEVDVVNINSGYNKLSIADKESHDELADKYMRILQKVCEWEIDENN